jgi:hypothetical protein
MRRALVLLLALSAPALAQTQPGYGPGQAGGSGGGGSTTITVAPGLTSTPGTQNTGTQTITNSSTVSPQNYPKDDTASYAMDTSAACIDTGTTRWANGSVAITYTLPAVGGACGLAGQSYAIADKSRHGYTITAVGGTSTFVGLGVAATSITLAQDQAVLCTSNGVTEWRCEGGTVSGSGTITWPTTGTLVLSNSSNSPAGLAPVNGSCALGSGGAWIVGSCGGSASPYTTIAGPVTVSNGATIDLDWHATNTYNVIDIVCRGVFPQSASDWKGLLGEGAGPTYQTTGYFNEIVTVYNSAAVGPNGASTTSLIGFGNPLSASAATAGHFSLRLTSAPSSTLLKQVSVQLSAYLTGVPSQVSGSGSAGYNADTNPITGFRLLAASGGVNINGTCTAIGSN